MISFSFFILDLPTQKKISVNGFIPGRRECLLCTIRSSLSWAWDVSEVQLSLRVLELFTQESQNHKTLSQPGPSTIRQKHSSSVFGHVGRHLDRMNNQQDYIHLKKSSSCLAKPSLSLYSLLKGHHDDHRELTD